MSQYPQHPHRSAPGQPGQWYPGPVPGYGGPVPPPANGRKRNRWLIVAVVVAVVAVAGGGVWFWQQQSGAGDSIAAQAGTRLELTVEDKFPADWQPDGDEAEMSVGSWVEGRWWTDDHLVREMPDEVIAYNVSGSVAWRIPVEGNGSCHSSEEMSPEGYVAVLRGDGMGSKAVKGCHQLTLIDTKAGKEVWTVELDQVGGRFPSSNSYPVIVGDLIHVSSDMGGQSRAVADGSRSDRTAQPTGCNATDYLGVDGTLVAWLRCRSDDETLWILAAYDENVKALWGWIFPEKGRKPNLMSVLSVDPLIVVMDKKGGQEIWRVEPGDGAVENPGTHSVVIAIGEEISWPCGNTHSTGLAVCDMVVVGDGVVYLRSNPLGISSGVHGIVAVDMATGKERWHARAEGELALAPITVDEDGRLIAYQNQAELSTANDLGYESPGTVVAVDPGTGGLTALAALPMVESGQKLERLVENQEHGPHLLEWRDGTLAFLAPVVVVTTAEYGGGPGSFASAVYSS